MNLEQLIERHKPHPGQEHEPCGGGQLQHLNENGLIEEAIEAQKQWHFDREEDSMPLVINKIVAWDVLARAQRAGLRLRPQRLDPGSFRGKPRRT